MTVHFTDNYLLNPQHKITVNLIGLGGTGSQVLNALTSLNEALNAKGHPGLHVYGYDGDIVSAANIGRQKFSPADVGINKAIVLISRVNRYFGYEWEALPIHYRGVKNANITISCVDSAAARLEINDYLKIAHKTSEPTDRAIYWLDFGNLKTTGQVVLGTVTSVKQPEKSKYKCVATLPNVVKQFPQMKKIKEVDQGPSCSLAQALGKQDLFMNPSIANLGMNILWNLFNDSLITSYGLYLNLKTMHVNPIKIK